MDGYWVIFACGAGFGVLMSYLVSDLVFPPTSQAEDDDN